MRAEAIVVTIAALILAGAFALGYATAPTTIQANSIRLESGVPVGVVNTPAGALAAADNYVASEDGSLLSPRAIKRVVDTVWEPRERDVELAQPFPAAALAGKPATFPGLRLAAAVAAHRIESYTPDAARIDVWHEVTIWSAALAPTQRWALDTVTLVWDSGRWLVASRSSMPDSQTPVPPWTSGGPADRTAEAFNTRLGGMSTSYYGEPQL